MSVSPGDVVSTSVGVLHVQSVVRTVVMERSREVVSFALSGVDGRGVVHSNIPIGEGVVPLAVVVSDAEALVWFDRERCLRRLGDAVFSPGDSVRALGRLMEGQAVDLSLCDREPVDAVLGWLGEVEANLIEGQAWVAERRMECLRLFEDFHAGWLKYQSKPWSEPGDILLGVKFRSGGVYRFQREGAVAGGEYEYFKVVGSRNISMQADTVKLLPIGSFKDIDSYRELSKYEGVSLPGALRDIFLDTFAAGDGKPKCLPARDELWRGEWMGDYGKCCSRLMDVTANMLFDIEKSVGYVRWLREQLEGFYRELGFSV